ncbi:MAG: VWA domain-containing protein [Ilumatobacteraceae bacterium]|nr:VWA domain-containing protein [Ilumatobacteraceae bacterium]
MAVTEPRFPFASVVGQDDAKLALQLLAVDPGIGGVLLRGEKGSAKTTLARGLADLLPGDAPFVDLPLGATEDRLIGTIDVATVLTSGETAVTPGLLAAAHGGVLYVDEINLLADHLVDTLLDVSVSGRNRIERDGISHHHDARFVLIGSMNPEEGELRPQLLDRFGLSVQITASVDPIDRAEAVRRRLRFDGIDVDSPGERRTELDTERDDLRAALAAARPATVPSELTEVASRLALAVGAQGLRADLVLCRAAAAYAGLAGRAVASDDDLREIAHLVLAHRSRRNPFDPPVLPPDQLADAIDDTRRDALPSKTPDSHHDAPDGHDSPPTTDDGDPRGSETSVSDEEHGAPPAGSGGTSSMAIGADRRPPSTALTPNGHVREATAGRRAMAEGTAGRLVRDVPFDAHATRPIAVVATVRRVAERRTSQSGADVDIDDVRYAVREQRAGSLLILVVDTSGSMGADDRARLATGTALGLLTDAYERRDHVALVRFGGDDAEVVLAPTGSVEVARNRLTSLETGGATPLAAGLRCALEVARSRRDHGRSPFVVVISDGRATGTPHAFDDALSAAGELRRAGIAGVVLDCEQAMPRLDLAARLADALDAPCLPAADLEPAAASTVIRTISQDVLDAR